jgi:predicted nucleic acid-binding protein
VARLVLTDASPLIALARADSLPLLRQLFGTVWMPGEVHQEVLTGSGLPGEAAFARAQTAGWLRVGDHTPREPALPDLDEGEAACIRMALAHVGPVLLLMDERAGRAVAIEHGLKVAGTAALIGMAKEQGLIPSAREVFARLHAADFRISAPVIEVILRRVGEQ